MPGGSANVLEDRLRLSKGLGSLRLEMESCRMNHSRGNHCTRAQVPDISSTGLGWGEKWLGPSTRQRSAGYGADSWPSSVMRYRPA